MRNFLCSILFLLASTELAVSDIPLQAWVAVQLKTRNAEFVRIVDQKPWPMSPVPNTFIILGIGNRIPKFDIGAKVFYFPFVILLKSDNANELKSPALLDISVPDETPDGWMSAMFVYPPDPLQCPRTIDLGPYQIAKTEYAFGVRYREASLGMKAGQAYEILGLFRYNDSRLKEIFRDVVWAYAKYEDGDKSCNAELAVTAQDTGQEFFSLVRGLRRSYYGDAKILNRPSPETAVASCRSFNALESSNVHRWNKDKGIYVGALGRMLQWDDLFKGYTTGGNPAPAELRSTLRFGPRVSRFSFPLCTFPAIR